MLRGHYTTEVLEPMDTSTLLEELGGEEKQRGL